MSSLVMCHMPGLDLFWNILKIWKRVNKFKFNSLFPWYYSKFWLYNIVNNSMAYWNFIFCCMSCGEGLLQNAQTSWNCWGFLALITEYMSRKQWYVPARKESNFLKITFLRKSLNNGQYIDYIWKAYKMQCCKTYSNVLLE